MSFFRSQILFRKKPFRNLQSYLFDRVNESIGSVGTVSDFSFIQNTAIFTISLWIKFTDNTITNQAFMGNNSGTGAQRGFYFLMENSPGTRNINLLVTNGITNVINARSASTPITDNNWHHLLITADGSNGYIYLDNAQIANAAVGTLSTGNSSQTLSIGRVNNLGGFLFGGNIDQVRFWNRAFSAADRADDYNNGKPKAPNQAGLVSSFPFDGDPFDGTNFSVRDHQGNNHGATVNMEYLDLEFDTP